MWPTFPDCDYYDEAYDQTSWFSPCMKIYYGYISKTICLYDGSGRWRDCVRACLQDRDREREDLREIENDPTWGVWYGCLLHLPAIGVDHLKCWISCL